jgi:peptidoglycan-N-acetylmuramic acid deacetylase
MIKKLQLILILFISTLLPFYGFNYKNNNSSRLIENMTNNQDTKELNWYFKSIGNGKTPLAPPDTDKYSTNYKLYFIGDTTKKNLYLTFDEGYENGFTAPILDILKKHNIKAAFFVVKPYINSNPDLIKRMVSEGHLVCNHSARHPSMAKIHDFEKFKMELSDVEACYKEVTGDEMPKFFRPPMGKYSELSLKFTKDMGYKTIFWSFAYKDWEINNQPTLDFAKKRILERTHPGAIILLHAVSKTNSQILDSVITEWLKQGYMFKTLNELP